MLDKSISLNSKDSKQMTASLEISFGGVTHKNTSGFSAPPEFGSADSSEPSTAEVFQAIRGKFE